VNTHTGEYSRRGCKRAVNCLNIYDNKTNFATFNTVYVFVILSIYSKQVYREI